MLSIQGIKKGEISPTGYQRATGGYNIRGGTDAGKLFCYWQVEGLEDAVITALYFDGSFHSVEMNQIQHRGRKQFLTKHSQRYFLGDFLEW